MEHDEHRHKYNIVENRDDRADLQHKLSQLLMAHRIWIDLDVGPVRILYTVII